MEDLLSIPDLTSSHLHDWINQHPSLVANMGTIRRMSKKRRHRVESGDFVSPPEGGARDSDSASSSRVSSSSDVTSPSVAGNQNENNNTVVMRSSVPSDISRSSRPRSWAISHTNGDEGTSGGGAHIPPQINDRKPAARMSSSPLSSSSSKPTQKPNHRRIASHRPMINNRNSSPKPYMETDL